MPDLKTLLIARFARVRKNLDEVISQLTDDMLYCCPADGMRTIRDQLFEIAGKESELLAYARSGGTVEWREVESFGEGEESIEGWKTILGDLRRRTITFIEVATDEELNAPVRFEEGWWEGLGLPEIPMHEVLRNIAAHEWYHTAQLISYLWEWNPELYRD